MKPVGYRGVKLTKHSFSTERKTRSMYTTLSFFEISEGCRRPSTVRGGNVSEMTHHRPNARLLIVASYHGPYICACLAAFETWRRAMQRRRGGVNSHERDESDNFSPVCHSWHKALPAERGKNGSRHVLLILHAHSSPPDQPGRSGHSVCGTHGPFLMPGRTR